MGRTGDSIQPHRNVTVTRFDMLRQFGVVKSKVLAVSSLHNIKVVLANTWEDVAFSKKLDRAFVRSDYRQSERW